MNSAYHFSLFRTKQIFCICEAGCTASINFQQRRKNKREIVSFLDENSPGFIRFPRTRITIQDSEKKMPGPNLKVPNGVDGHISTEAMHDVLRNVAEDMTHHAHSEPIMKSLFDRGAAIAHRVLWQRPNCPDTNQTASKCYDAMAAALPGVKPRIRVAVVYEQ